MVLVIPFQALIFRNIKTYQMEQMKNKDRRNKMMDEILNGMKIIKLYAWESSFLRKVNAIRDQEIYPLKVSHTLFLSSPIFFRMLVEDLWLIFLINNKIFCSTFVVSTITKMLQIRSLFDTTYIRPFFLCMFLLQRFGYEIKLANTFVF